MHFLGMAGYYRKFCNNFSSMSAPLTDLLKKNCKFVWNENCKIPLKTLRPYLVMHQCFWLHVFCKPFKLAVDASDVRAGGVLLQEDENGVDHPVCYFSHKFNKHQKVYSTIEKECLALILSLQFFKLYVSSSSFSLTVVTGHIPLTFLNKMKNTNQRMLRWSLFLQEYNLNLTHIKGRDNVIADALQVGVVVKLVNFVCKICYFYYILMCITLLDI